jgi:hypothetical protein
MKQNGPADGTAEPGNKTAIGQLGRDAFPGCCYAIERGVAAVGNSKPQADIPYVVEAFAKKRVSAPASIVRQSRARSVSIEIQIKTSAFSAAASTTAR